MIYGNPKAYFKDFCPLCGSRFYGDNPEEVYDLIADHLKENNGESYCAKHWRPFDEALTDTGKDIATRCKM
jgi:predicted small metal-binding protein